MDTERVERARSFAFRAHGDQKYGDFPYMTHLESVVAILKEFGFTSDVFLAAGYLHDTLEDTHVNYGDLEREFGVTVADAVYDVTDELGRNREERHRKTYPKTAQNVNAIIVKLADRISNVRQSLKSGGKLDMYKKEYVYFQAILRSDNESTKAMWSELDKILA